MSTSGLPFGVAIMTQLSGPVGGRRVYVLSTSTSVTVTVTVTANSLITLVTATTAAVIITPSQVPQLEAVCIQVTVT